MKIEDDTLFGRCGFCNKWVPRDVMRSYSLRMYGEGVGVVERTVRLRACPACHESEVEKLISKEWDGVLYSAAELRANKELSDMCDSV
jgi:hypothetical protein